MVLAAAGRSGQRLMFGRPKKASAEAAGQGQEGGGDVNVDDAVAIALLGVFGRKPESPDGTHADQQNTGQRQPWHPNTGFLVEPAR